MTTSGPNNASGGSPIVIRRPFENATPPWAPPSGTAVVVPLSAIQMVDNRTVVFVPGGEEGEFAARPVTVGRESPRQAEVIEGLEAGARVVVAGAFVLKSELMRGQLGHGHAH